MYINSVTFCKLDAVKMEVSEGCLRAICEILGLEIANCKFVCVQNQKVLLDQKIR